MRRRMQKALIRVRLSLNLSLGHLVRPAMEHDLPEWIRHIRTRFTSERLLPLDGSLPKPIIERLAALEDAERRRSGDRGDAGGRVAAAKGMGNVA